VQFSYWPFSGAIPLRAPTVTKFDLPRDLLWFAGNPRDCAIQSAWASHQKRGNSQAASIQSPSSDPHQPRADQFNTFYRSSLSRRRDKTFFVIRQTMHRTETPMKLFALILILAFLPTLWAESPGDDEFVTQVLEPTGGKIVRPKDWFYAESHRGPVYLWTISAEDTTGGKPYTTGVRIQTIVGVQNGTGKTAEKFLADFVASKKNDKRVVVIKTCKETKSGLFNRICLETEEGGDHILYSLFWGTDELDIAVVVIAGTTKELWDTHAPNFRKMEEFELIDMNRIEK